MIKNISLLNLFATINYDDRIITLHTLFPLYQNELEYKIENGYGKFFDVLIEGNIPDIFNNNRKNLFG
ncbi:suppressor of fused domain protein [Chryseobacterium sp. StRB126]|uniref:suppressor of fused domain protein n=1 Tax=Chryseobacterium sp. StRB126 TaxID=878220 RepID=UPI000A02E44F